VSTSNTARVKLKFQWRKAHSKECYVAICDAVRLGYDTNEALSAALPQFSINRLVLALDHLLAAHMAHLNMNTLTVDNDMLIVETLAAGQVLELPLEAEQLVRNDPLLSEILLGIGVQNPAGVLALLKPKVEEMT
jgi:hypothetical protein